MRNSTKLKICLAASAGGHLTQLLELAESWQQHNPFFIVTSELVHERLAQYGKVYVVSECNRQHLLKVLKTLYDCIKIVFSEKPDIVISTGAAGGCLVCFVAKFLKAKIIWVDSVTNIEKPSLSGRLVMHIADLFLVQWPELAEKYKNIEFVGSII